ncbi:MAG TPA: hypothetical protein VE994_05545 [Terriglobales bacterium]|nr:hypothetical protein [Terriglobales bacterium]
MFLPSDDARRHLCNALHALRQPEKLLENHGLIAPNSYVDYDDDVPHPRKPSWEDLKRDLADATEKKSGQLRNLCSEVLRRRNDTDWFYEHPLDNCPSSRFLDEVAQFEARLLDGGYKFDGFEILDGKTVPSVAQRADESLLKTFESGDFPEIEKVRSHLSAGSRMLSSDKYNESLNEFRLALQQCLRIIARRFAEQRNEELPSFKEDRDLRDYLENKGFLTREEKKGFDGIYGLLSSGAHGKGDENSALLGYAACVMACHYAIKKAQHLQAGQP